MAQTMLLQVHRPRSPLALHVDYLWSLRDVPRHATEHVLPTGTLELVFNLAQDAVQVRSAEGQLRLGGALVSGVYRRYFVIDTRDHADMVGVHFKPGGAWSILGAAPGELADKHINLEDVWGGAQVRSLREQLAAATTEQRLPLLEASLSARFMNNRPLHPACSTALDALARDARVADVAAMTGLSPRRLQDVFQQQVGTTPKLFARISRFQRAVLALARPSPKGPELALSAGYFDQSHLIREFHALAGSVPSSLTHALQVPVKQHHVAVPRSSDSSNT